MLQLLEQTSRREEDEAVDISFASVHLKGNKGSDRAPDMLQLLEQTSRREEDEVLDMSFASVHLKGNKCSDSSGTDSTF